MWVGLFLAGCVLLNRIGSFYRVELDHMIDLQWKRTQGIVKLGLPLNNSILHIYKKPMRLYEVMDFI